eukprot:2371838-Amphidinium_carterae.2
MAVFSNAVRSHHPLSPPFESSQEIYLLFCSGKGSGNPQRRKTVTERLTTETAAAECVSVSVYDSGPIFGNTWIGEVSVDMRSRDAWHV